MTFGGTAPTTDTTGSIGTTIFIIFSIYPLIYPANRMLNNPRRCVSDLASTYNSFNTDVILNLVEMNNGVLKKIYINKYNFNVLV